VISVPRLGYACINLTLGRRGMTNRTCRLANATPERLEALSRANLDGLAETLRWNVAHDIEVFRISSDLIPLASHPRAQWPWREALSDELAQIGEYARRHGPRLSTHPGQYTVLNSPAASVVEQAVAELEYHASLLDALGLPASCKIVLHVGGVYGDRSAALARFRETFRRVSERVQRRLIIENDERCYGADDVLELSHALGMPVVFDALHHRVHAGAPASRALLDDVCATWKPADGPPKLHFSSQKPDGRPGAHAEYVDESEFAAFADLLRGRAVDVMLEAKAKERALLHLRRALGS
jgi:UV DNA damage endonuclease